MGLCFDWAFKVNPNAKTVWASEICPKTRKLLRHTLGPDAKIYDDMLKKGDASEIEPVDIYIAGPSCQPWSGTGDSIVYI